MARAWPGPGDVTAANSARAVPGGRGRSAARRERGGAKAERPDQQRQQSLAGATRPPAGHGPTNARCRCAVAPD